MGFHVSAVRSAWKSYGTQNMAAGPEPWGDVKPALIGLGTRAAPVLDQRSQETTPEMLDWECNEPEAFTNQAQAGSE